MSLDDDIEAVVEEGCQNLDRILLELDDRIDGLGEYAGCDVAVVLRDGSGLIIRVGFGSTGAHADIRTYGPGGEQVGPVTQELLGTLNVRAC